MSVVVDGNLPVALSDLVGRKQELEALRGVLQRARLVSLVGPGGAGKTRLALGLAERVVGSFDDGAWWLELGDLSGPGLVEITMVTTCGVDQSPGEEPLAALVRAFRSLRSLVVLDDCEHVVDECAALAQRLLGACPGLKIIATSREPLGVPGERVFRLGGLGYGPGTGDGVREAVELFLERVQASVPGFELRSGDLQHIAGICERLDGLPLAVELAAARAGVLSVSEIAQRLEDAGSFLHQANRTAPPRHRTLDDALDWSYQLLPEPEQKLFAILSAFRGSFSLLAAEAVGAGAGIERQEVLRLLAALVDKSLVQVADRGPEHRYRLLNTIHAYSQTKLGDLPEGERVYDAHAEFFVGLAVQANDGLLEGPEQAQWLNRIELEHDNLRAVLRRNISDRPEVAGRLTGLLWPFWYRRGYYHEARSWLEQAVDASDRMTPEVAASVLTGAGVIAFLQCDYPLAETRLRRALALYQHEDDQIGVAGVLQRLGSIAREQARYDEARQLHESARTLWARLGDPRGVASAEDYLAFVDWLEGDGEAAGRHASRALSHFEAAGLQQETAAALVNSAMAAYYAGDRTLAIERLRRALSISRDISYLEGVAWAAHELGAITHDQDPGAGALLDESLRTHVALGDIWRAASVLETTAAKVLAAADPARSVRLIAASHSLRESIGAPVPPAERPTLDEALAGCKATLGAAEFAQAWTQGLAISLEQAVEQAIEQAPTLPERTASEPASAIRATDTDAYDLTEREIAVLRLVSQGLTNRQIGAELYISPGTAAIHVSHILRKLGVATRVQAAGIAHQLNLNRNELAGS
ncbi:MAG: tetratricopeptide repeat protein [Solirubrobacteraceae bacterium]